jgi:hypothetical protein
VAGGPYDALGNVYNDGVTIGANLGETDGLGAKNIQLWRGHLNLTTTWTWGQFTNLQLDGDNTNLTILGTNGAGFTQITNCYSTNDVNSGGYPIHINTVQLVTFVNLELSAALNSNAGLFVEQGSVTVTGGHIWAGMVSGQAMVSLHNACSLTLRDMRLDTGSGGVNAYVSMFDFTTLHMSDCVFMRNVAGLGDATYYGVSGNTNTTVTLDNIFWNGWKVDLPTGKNNWLPSQPSYANDAAAAAGGVPIGVEYRNGSIRMVRVT